jgi:diphthine-ammonia ligase
MKVVGLISGGKDSIFNLYQCLLHGHEIVALANIYPEAEAEKDERDSFMYQTVGYTVIPLIAQCLELPLYRKALKGTSLNQNLQYAPSQSSDEVEDLLALLQEVKSKHPDVQAVSSGAILSTYQRTRVENVYFNIYLHL